MVRRLGAVQLDTISVLARSHELVAYARHGAVGRAAVERAYWGRGSATFEYWSHAACVVPLEDWPLYEFKRRARRAKGKRWHTLADRERSCAEVVDRLQAEGPLTANELGGAKKSGVWWDWSETKIAAEWLLDIGDLVCRERRGFQRVYDLTERAIPARLRRTELADEECAVRLVAAAGRSLGVGTLGDLAVYHGLPQRLVRTVLPGAGLVPVRVQGWKPLAYADPTALAALGPEGQGEEPAALPVRLALLVPGPPRTALRRAAPLGGLHAAAPAHLRLLRHARAGRAPRSSGLVDPGRRDGALVAKQVTLFRGRERGPRRRRPRRRGALGRVRSGHRGAGRTRARPDGASSSLVAEAASDFD